MKKVRMTLGAVVFFLATMPFLVAHAAAMNGWYGSLELGLTRSPEVTLSQNDNDFESSAKCDGFFVDPTGADCSARGNYWKNTFGGVAGGLSGLGVGYRLGNIRIEAEYFYHIAGYDEQNEPEFGFGLLSKVTNEAITASVKFSSLASHNVFLNAYYDLPIGTKFRPYVGAGVGRSRVSFEYSANFTRSVNLQNDDGTRSPLAGSATVEKETLSEDVFGYQLIAGIDYLLSDRVSLGLKFRWTEYGEVKTDKRSWDYLRSHASFTGPGGEPILWVSETDDIQFWGLSLVLKYRF